MSASPTKNDGEEPTSNKPEIPLNDREKELFIIAIMYCIKSGPVKIDFDKFTTLGGFNTKKTAQNTWSKINVKLPAIEEAEDGGESDAKKPPKKKATPKKRAKKSEDVVEEGNEEEEEEEEASPTKKVKKTPAKKGKAKADPKVEEEGEEA